MARDTRFRTLLASESSVSEVIATVLLAGTTVVLLGGFSLVLMSSMGTTDDPTSASFSIRADEGADAVLLTMVDGSPFRLDGAMVVLVLNGTGATGAIELVDPASPGTWAPGGALRVGLSRGTLEPDARVLALVVDRDSGKTVGMAHATVVSPAGLPAYVTSEPSAGAVSLVPGTLTVDGASLANLSVQAATTHGVGLVRSVSVDLTALGGASDVALLDDGEGADALAGDGVFTARIKAVSHAFAVVPSVETVRLPITVQDVLGKRATAQALLSVQPAAMSKVTVSAEWRDLPASGEVRWINVTNFTFRDVAALDDDQVQVRVSDLGGTRAWTALVGFGSPAACGGSPGVSSVRLARDDVPGSVLYTPDPGPCLAIGALTQLDLSNVTGSRDAAGALVSWNVAGDAASHVYSAAGIGAPNEATVSFLGDGVSPSPAALGFGQADLTWARVVENMPPSASFTASATMLSLAVDAGASSDPEGRALAYAWEWGDGASSPASGSPTATHAYALPGAYVVNLTVTDPQGAIGRASATLTLTAPAANAPPTASLAANRTAGTAPLGVDFTLAGSDADGSVASWSLDFGDGTSANGTALPILQGKTYNASGTHEAVLTVTDDDGATATGRVTVSVNARPTATLVAVPTSGNAPLPVTFTLGGSDPDGSIASWTLDYGDGTSATGTTLPAVLAKTYAASGVYSATLTVTDDDGATHEASVTIAASANLPPTATLSANATSGTAPHDVRFTLGGSDADGTVVAWTLRLGDGATQTGVTLPATLDKRYAASGAYVAELTVTDNQGASATSSLTVTVNERPSAAFVVASTTGLIANVDGAASGDADGSVVSWLWQWGDGTTSTTTVPAASRTYANAGTYAVNLTVTDDRGATSAPASRTLSVNRDPVMGGVTVTAQHDLNVTLDASAMDPDGQALTYTYAWGDATNVSLRGSATGASHTYATPGNHTVTVYANDTMGASATTTLVVQATRTQYAQLAVTDFGSPGGAVTDAQNVQAADGLEATFTETAVATGASQPASRCDSGFDGCGIGSSNWTWTGGGFKEPFMSANGTGSTLVGGTSGNALVFETRGDGPNGLRTGSYRVQWSQTADATAQAGNFTMAYRFSAIVPGQSVTMALVAPDGAVTSLGTAGSVDAAWRAYPSASVPATTTRQGGTFTLFANVTVDKNDQIYLDDLGLRFEGTGGASSLFRLQKQMSVTGLPGGALSHHLEVRATNAGSEGLVLLVEGPAGTWTQRATLAGSAPQTLVYKLGPGDIVNGAVNLRLVDASATSDNVADSWRVDHVRVVVRG